MEKSTNPIKQEINENNSIHIENLAYLIQKAHSENLPKPIVFIGAGASKSAGIPLTYEIIKDVKRDFKDKPSIKELIRLNETDYYKVMQALTADERRDLFYGYITDEKVKINLTNIYLAQLLQMRLIDFVLTVNFDDLLLRACALFNFLPPVYDVSNIEVPTTSNFRENSVIYLHGQHFGQWLLNSNSELGKVKKVVPNVFNEIKNRRTWIVVGYSGNDEILEHIKDLGSFTNNLYWVNHLKTPPSDKVSEFIENPNSNAYLIKGYDSDSFFFSLHAALKALKAFKAFECLNLETPQIFVKPFSTLKSTLEKIIDINGKEYEEIDMRLNNAKKHVNYAIELFEKGNSEFIELREDIEIDLMENQIIEVIASKSFNKDKIEELTIKASKFGSENIKNLMAALFYNWGNNISAKISKNEVDFKLAIENYEKAIELNPKLEMAYYNLGNAIQNYALINNTESLFELSSEKYQTSININPNNDNAFLNWGNALYKLALIRNDEEIWDNSFDKFKKAIKINPNNSKAYNSWGSAILEKAKILEVKNLFEKSIEKFELAIDLDSKNPEFFNNKGAALIELAALKKSENLYKKSFEEFEKATELNSKLEAIFANWGFGFISLAKLKNYDTILLEESINKYEIALSLGGKYYNLSCAYALKKDKTKALEILEKAFKNKEVTSNDVVKDEDWNSFLNDNDFIVLLKKYS